MLPIYLGVYIFTLAIVWGFFFVARHHSYKFKHFSTHIAPVTNLLLVFLLILSVLGFVMIFFLGDSGPSISVNKQEPTIENYY